MLMKIQLIGGSRDLGFRASIAMGRAGVHVKVAGANFTRCGY